MAREGSTDESKEHKQEPTKVGDDFTFQSVQIGQYAAIKTVLDIKPLPNCYEPFEIAGYRYQHMAVLPDNQFALVVIEPKSNNPYLFIFDYISQEMLKQLPLPGFKKPYLYGLPNGQLIISEIQDTKNHAVIFDVSSALMLAQTEISVSPYRMPIIYKNYVAWIDSDNKCVLIFKIEDFSKAYSKINFSGDIAALFAITEVDGLVVVPRQGEPQIYRDQNNTFECINKFLSDTEMRKVKNWTIEMIDRASPISQSSFCNSKDAQLTYYPPASDQQEAISHQIRIIHGSQSISLAHSSTRKTAQIHLTDGYFYGKAYKVTGKIEHVVFFDDDLFAVNSAEGVSIHLSLRADMRVRKAKQYFGEHDEQKNELTLDDEAKNTLTFWGRRAEKLKSLEASRDVVKPLSEPSNMSIVLEVKNDQIPSAESSKSRRDDLINNAGNPQAFFTNARVKKVSGKPPLAEDQSKTAKRTCWRRFSSCVLQ